MKKIAITCALLSSLVASSVWADAASDLKSRLDKVSSFHASFTQKVTDGSGAAVQEGQGDLWKKRIGTPQDSMPFPMPVPVPFNMGMPMLGGPISTAGNVLFIAATADNYLRAYNMSNGEKLWQGRLPAGGQATPMKSRAR